jgi:hypothetical protein
MSSFRIEVEELVKEIEGGAESLRDLVRGQNAQFQKRDEDCLNGL